MRFCVHPIICVRFCKGSEVDYSSCSVLSFRPVVGCYLCNRVHLHSVFVLLYVLCVSLCRCSFVCVRHSIFYVCVTCCDLDVTIRLTERAREKTRGNNNSFSHVPSKRKEEIKSGTSGCGSFVVPYFQPATSTDRLHLALTSRIGSREAE